MAALIASFVGAYSHILFDAIMHADVLPNATIGSRSLLGLVGPGALHLFCFLLGVLAILVWGWRNRKAGGDSKI